MNNNKNIELEGSKGRAREVIDFSMPTFFPSIVIKKNNDNMIWYNGRSDSFEPRMTREGERLQEGDIIWEDSRTQEVVDIFRNGKYIDYEMLEELKECDFPISKSKVNNEFKPIWGRAKLVKFRGKEVGAFQFWGNIGSEPVLTRDGEYDEDWLYFTPKNIDDSWKLKTPFEFFEIELIDGKVRRTKGLDEFGKYALPNKDEVAKLEDAKTKVKIYGL